ncbi:competence/damage-inducible protein A [Paenibacillus sp. UMB4589-SE434]|uniref:competence/damage-inducible protein A n=1 Tax=Paenibacillus sp. UMB4589-SE434 TaxID=3046314 RepID=UPI00254C1722|nr:competence/damage-inducible protein A [Paenibacillus sp. UMB4589-SE434]MDK8180655.1 competence/damage-inducible protein A [Paenibacillus sp. UMB4589-SE434]
MKAEMIAVGTELLLGQIVNTNAQYLSQQLALLGVDVYYQTVVGDNPHRLRDVIQTASKRADIVLLTGGLGPTLDDITKDVVAELLGRGMLIHEPSMRKMEDMFKGRGIHMVDSNRRQANWIEGSDALANEAGLALGNAVLHEDVAYILLPGPPKEMKPMFQLEVVPWLEKHLFDERTSLYTRMLKFAGIGESNLEAQLLDLIESQSDPTIAPYAKEGEVLIRLATKSDSKQEAGRKLDELESVIRGRLGQHIFATEDVSLEHVIVEQMTKLGLTLSAAESCTGGLFSELVTSVPGSSVMFHGGVVSYANALKQKLLNVPSELLEGENAPGAVSQETARAMAEGLLQLTGTDIAVSITGVAGPGQSERKPAGLVFIGIAQAGQETLIEELRLNGNRDMIRLRAVKILLHRIWRLLQERK